MANVRPLSPAQLVDRWSNVQLARVGDIAFATGYVDDLATTVGPGFGLRTAVSSYVSVDRPPAGLVRVEPVFTPEQAAELQRLLEEALGVLDTAGFDVHSVPDTWPLRGSDSRMA